MKNETIMNSAKIAVIVMAVLLVFNSKTAEAADDSQSTCRCFNYYGAKDTTDINKRILIKDAMVPGMDEKSEDNCHQLCANEQNNPDISKRPTIYIFSINGKEKQITKKPGAAVPQAPQNICSCDNGIPQTPQIISEKAVDTEEGCIVVCQQAEGATRYRFGISTTNPGNWKDIPAPIGSVKPATPKKFDYKLLESFPGFFNAGQTLTDLPAMILAIYKFGIWTVGIAGLFMLVIGGFMYMTSAGNTSTAGTARGIIWDALIGIVAALGAYLILYVINPDLTKLNLSFTSVKVEEAAPIPSGTMSDADARKLLQQNGISVTSSGNCSDPKNKACTSLQGIPERTVGALINIKKLCTTFSPGCKVIVTGGTEDGHQSHGAGLPAIDVNSDAGLKKYLLERKTKSELGLIGISQICTTNANSDLRYRCDFVESAEHFHLYFGV